MACRYHITGYKGIINETKTIIVNLGESSKQGNLKTFCSVYGEKIDVVIVI